MNTQHTWTHPGDIPATSVKAAVEADGPYVLQPSFTPTLSSTSSHPTTSPASEALPARVPQAPTTGPPKLSHPIPFDKRAPTRETEAQATTGSTTVAARTGAPVSQSSQVWSAEGAGTLFTTASHPSTSSSSFAASTQHGPPGGTSGQPSMPFRAIPVPKRIPKDQQTLIPVFHHTPGVDLLQLDRSTAEQAIRAGSVHLELVRQQQLANARNPATMAQPAASSQAHLPRGRPRKPSEAAGAMLSGEQPDMSAMVISNSHKVRVPSTADTPRPRSRTATTTLPMLFDREASQQQQNPTATGASRITPMYGMSRATPLPTASNVTQLSSPIPTATKKTTKGALPGFLEWFERHWKEERLSLLASVLSAEELAQLLCECSNLDKGHIPTIKDYVQRKCEPIVDDAGVDLEQDVQSILDHLAYARQSRTVNALSILLETTSFLSTSQSLLLNVPLDPAITLLNRDYCLQAGESWPQEGYAVHPSIISLSGLCELWDEVLEATRKLQSEYDFRAEDYEAMATVLSDLRERWEMEGRIDMEEADEEETEMERILRILRRKVREAKAAKERWKVEHGEARHQDAVHLKRLEYQRRKQLQEYQEHQQQQRTNASGKHTSTTASSLEASPRNLGQSQFTQPHQSSLQEHQLQLYLQLQQPQQSYSQHIRSTLLPPPPQAQGLRIVDKFAPRNPLEAPTLPSSYSSLAGNAASEVVEKSLLALARKRQKQAKDNQSKADSKEPSLEALELQSNSKAATLVNRPAVNVALPPPPSGQPIMAKDSKQIPAIVRRTRKTKPATEPAPIHPLDLDLKMATAPITSRNATSIAMAVSLPPTAPLSQPMFSSSSSIETPRSRIEPDVIENPSFAQPPPEPSLTTNDSIMEVPSDTVVEAIIASTVEEGEGELYDLEQDSVVLAATSDMTVEKENGLDRRTSDLAALAEYAEALAAERASMGSHQNKTLVKDLQVAQEQELEQKLELAKQDDGMPVEHKDDDGDTLDKEELSELETAAITDVFEPLPVKKKAVIKGESLDKESHSYEPSDAESEDNDDNDDKEFFVAADEEEEEEEDDEDSYDGASSSDDQTYSRSSTRHHRQALPPRPTRPARTLTRQNGLRSKGSAVATSIDRTRSGSEAVASSHRTSIITTRATRASIQSTESTSTIKDRDRPHPQPILEASQPPPPPASTSTPVPLPRRSVTRAGSTPSLKVKLEKLTPEPRNLRAMCRESTVDDAVKSTPAVQERGENDGKEKQEPVQEDATEAAVAAGEEEAEVAAGESAGGVVVKKEKAVVKEISRKRSLRSQDPVKRMTRAEYHQLATKKRRV